MVAPSAVDAFVAFPVGGIVLAGGLCQAANPTPATPTGYKGFEVILSWILKSHILFLLKSHETAMEGEAVV